MVRGVPVSCSLDSVSTCTPQPRGDVVTAGPQWGSREVAVGNVSQLCSPAVHFQGPYEWEGLAYRICNLWPKVLCI